MPQNRVTDMMKSMSRALLVGLATWIAVADVHRLALVPAHNALRCFSNSLIATGIVGGGPLLIGAMVAGVIVGLVLRRRPVVDLLRWPAPVLGDPTPTLDSTTDAR